MSRNTLLLVASVLAILAGGLVSYFPPAQNGVAIWSLVSMAVGYGIRDLFGVQPDAPAASAPPAPIPAQPGFAAVPPVPTTPTV